MIFKETWQQVLDGTKTQTRRPVKPGDFSQCLIVYRPDEITHVVNAQGKTRWRFLGDYGVQPGRGKKAVGRIRITKIRRERLQEITSTDCMAEGIDNIIKEWNKYISDYWRRLACQAYRAGDFRMAFKHIWNSLYRKPYRWEDNPEVWALEFERVRKTSSA